MDKPAGQNDPLIFTSLLVDVSPRNVRFFVALKSHFGEIFHFDTVRENVYGNDGSTPNCLAYYGSNCIIDLNVFMHLLCKV